MKNVCSFFKSGFVSAFAMMSFLAGCSGDNVAGGASGDAGIVAVKDWEVAGVSQKGPFVTGSAVTVQELDGITLKQTGKSFKGTIKSDKGDFAIKDINLQSQYAILEASGYYRDEISGKKSSGMVTLRAFTDLSNRKTVNINLLTHLEYERVMYLVTEKKKSIAEAKEQAEKEILATFGIEGDFAESEDLNIFESGDGNAALLAVSVLMQSDVDVAGLTERMGEFSISLAEGGSWDDADVKTAIADWACDVDLKGSLSKVRKNVEDWKYADTVPAFEKYVTNFWWENYGLGSCTAKREGDVKRNVNKLSKLYNEYFVCENGRWRIPNDDVKSSSSNTSAGSATSSSEATSSSSDAKSSSSVKLLSSSSEKTESSSSSVVSSSSSEVSSSSYFDPFEKQSSSSAAQKKDSLPDLPDELSFVEKYLEKKTEYIEYAEGKQIVWRGVSPWYHLGAGGATVAPWDSAGSALVQEAVENGFEYVASYSNDSLDNDYVNESHVYSKTSDGRVYTLVLTKSAVTTLSFVMHSMAQFYVKVIVRDADIDEIPTENEKDYNSPKYRVLPEDLKFIDEAIVEPRRYSRGYSNDPMSTYWIYSYTIDGYASGAESLSLAMTKVEEYASMMESHGFTLKSKDDVTLAEIESMGLGNDGFEHANGKEIVTLYRYEKEVEGFLYKAELYSSIDVCGGEMIWFETHASIKITIYDK